MDRNVLGTSMYSSPSFKNNQPGQSCLLILQPTSTHHQSLLSISPSPSNIISSAQDYFEANNRLYVFHKSLNVSPKIKLSKLFIRATSH